MSAPTDPADAEARPTRPPRSADLKLWLGDRAPFLVGCAMLIALLAISVGAADAAARLGTFVLFGLGFGLPLILLSLVGAARGQVFTRWVASHHAALLRVAGVLLIITALAEPLRIILSEQG